MESLQQAYAGIADEIARLRKEKGDLSRRLKQMVGSAEEGMRVVPRLKGRGATKLKCGVWRGSHGSRCRGDLGTSVGAAWTVTATASNSPAWR